MVGRMTETYNFLLRSHKVRTKDWKLKTATNRSEDLDSLSDCSKRSAHGPRERPRPRVSCYAGQVRKNADAGRWNHSVLGALPGRFCRKGLKAS